VASSKTFTATIMAGYLLALWLGRHRGTLTPEDGRRHVQGLLELPRLIEKTLELDAPVANLARELTRFKDFLFFARGIHFPIALEGALKLKELSYLHAEGYPAGEMKHGPIALIDENMPVVALVPKDSTYDRMMSNVEEVRARDGRIIAPRPQQLAERMPFLLGPINILPVAADHRAGNGTLRLLGRRVA